MEPTEARPWYKKKRYIIPLGLWALISLTSGTEPQTVQPSVASQPATTIQRAAPIVVPTVQDVPTETPKVVAPAPKKVTPTNTNPELSNDNYYTNTAGNQVHSPAYSDTIPAGATAQCRDGTYSFSQSRRGTCSHHGGVSRWLN